MLSYAVVRFLYTPELSGRARCGEESFLGEVALRMSSYFASSLGSAFWLFCAQRNDQCEGG